MPFMILLGLIGITIYYCITWMLPKVLAYYLMKKLNIQIESGRFSLPFSFRAVKIIKNGFCIQIDEITIRSSFSNSEVGKLLSITIRDIRVNKDVNETVVVEPNGGRVSSELVADPNSNALDFRNKKVPPFIIKFAQFMCVNMQKISVVMMNNTSNPSWFLHATAGDLMLDGSTLHSPKTLVVTAALSDARVKFFRHYPSSMYETHKLKPCLAELSFGIALDGIVNASGPIAVDKMQLQIKQTQAYIHDGLYDFIRDTNYMNQIEKKTKQKSTQSINIDELCQCISPVIPKSFTVKVDKAAFSAVRDDSTDDFTAKLVSFALNGKFATNSEDNTFRLPFMYTAMQLEQFEIDTQQEKLLFVKLFTIDTKLEHKVLNAFFKIQSFQFVYNHEEIYEQ